VLKSIQAKEMDMNTPVLNEIVKKIKTLPDNLQRQVLIFVDALQVSSQRGTPGKLLLDFAGTISAGDLMLMEQAIESGCEQVDDSEW
jgi:hypothetical protein